MHGAPIIEGYVRFLCDGQFLWVVPQMEVNDEDGVLLLKTKLALDLVLKMRPLHPDLQPLLHVDHSDKIVTKVLRVERHLRVGMAEVHDVFPVEQSIIRDGRDQELKDVQSLVLLEAEEQAALLLNLLGGGEVGLVVC